ncbi:N-acetylmuramoyl-L-alanine amidase [Pseudonocardia charpentierae]|uniref:N-acetylmuramoyl-L-alanine amidase n=1 Tax=Pseudonocardia charpentierae TaxID=3075545 RepID=A0ABU2NEY0_9PSEU|nr:N-acetylmuramoyl-L-alanine amidase [Pseudonocardia sp. DSM 45834]MDT0352517.1 N-acetylmuramoyl-L-alanine amidase [Pseudonocardia sp. DSM 45834]
MPALLRSVFRSGTVVAVLVLAACSSPPAAPAPASPTAPATVGTPPTSATVSAAPAAATTSPRPRVVVLDPGHNGGNAGAPAAINRQVPDGRGGTKACNTTGTSTDAGYAEHAFTLDVAQRVEKRLVASGVRVELTRTDDDGVGPCVDERGSAGERAGADAVVSIHADGAAPSGKGFHVAYSDPPLNAAQRGPARTLAADLRDGLAAAGFPRSTYTGRDGLSPRTDLAGLNLSTRPTALVECANMRNAAEAALVSSAAGRDRYAAAIADGILRFLDS